MKRFLSNRIVKNLVFPFILLFTTVSCFSREPQYVKIFGNSQGTTYHITYQNSLNINLQPEVEKRLKYIDGLFSTFNENSALSKINRSSVPVVLPGLLEELIKRSFLYNKESAGGFDITVGPLVNAWGFGDSKSKMPSKNQVDSLLQFVGQNKLKIKNHKLIKADPRMQIDLNSIAQGFTVDYLSNYFDSLGIKNYLIEVGGELMARGKNAQGAPWKVGIETPSDDNKSTNQSIQKIIGISNLAVSTSGNYRRFFVVDGVKYSHTIDPHTGDPVRNTLLSATIVADNCTDADAYATVCMVLGLDNSIKFLKNKPHLRAYLIYSGSKGEYLTYYTDNMKELFVQ
jgi:thiamine biosynthesis lipoprotein